MATQTFPLIGSLTMWTTEVLPDGYLVADGSSVFIQDYPDLYDVIGVRYGVGDQPGLTFNLPDVRGLFPRFTTEDSTRDPDRFSRTPPGVGGTSLSPGSKQANIITAHNHSLGMYTLNIFNLNNVPATGLNAFTVNTTTNVSGDSVENRPKNISVVGLIKY